jgi:ribonuclease VapC
MGRADIPMVVDTSALLALLQEEPDAPALRHALAADPLRLISTVSVLEATCVLAARRGPSAVSELSLFLVDLRFERVAFTPDQLALAQSAWLRYGRGFHPARLNFGDCAPYALSQATGEPLLFIGNDFAQTDVSAVALL